MGLRRHAILALTFATLSSAGPAVAAPSISQKVQQCDGSYSLGTVTNHPTPKVRAEINDPNGLRIGKVKMGMPNGSKALWRFTGGESFSAGACVETAWDAYSNPTAWQKTYTYSYDEPENSSSIVTLGSCVYSSANTCATYTLTGGGRVPVGLSACPASPPSGSIAGTILTGAGNGANFGNAAAFDGVQFGSITYNVTIGDPSPTYTMSAWIYPTNVTGNRRIISQEGASGKWVFGLSGTGVRHFDSRDALSSDGQDAARGTSVSINAWHQIHVVRTNAGRRFYVDGNLVGTAVAISTDSFYPSHPIGTPILIGNNAALSEGFIGRIDEIRVMDSALSDEDIKLEYLGTHHRYSTDSGSNYNDVLGLLVRDPPTGSIPSVNTDTYTFVNPPGPETSTSRFIFKAQNINTASTVSSNYLFTIDTGKPTAPSIAGTGGAGFITWSWSAPTKVCSGPGLPIYYELRDPLTGALVLGAIPTGPVNETVLAPNTSRARMVLVHDYYGDSPLSVAATAYNYAAVPTSLALTDISTGGVAVSWSDNSNPGYTRYEVTYSPDDFVATTSTRIAYANDFRALATNLTGLAAGTTYFLRVRAFNGQSADFSGGIATTFLTGSFVTRPTAPVLTGTAVSSITVRWDWTHPSGASGYNLYDLLTSAVLAAGAVVTHTSTTLTVNTRHDAEVEAYVPEPAYATPQPTASGERASAYVYTLATAPVSPSVWAMYSSSGIFVWNANGNPSYTNYELSIATDASFSVVIATLGVSGTTATVSDLLPGTSYFARVRAFNGDQIPAPLNSFIVFAATSTRADPNITVSSAPPSPYVSPVGIEGVWQFDEGTGLDAADGSGAGNSAQLTCTAALCASTPTFAAGPTALGTAASFSGLESGVVETRSNFPTFNDDLTVEAWVYPQSASQRDYAGLVALGRKDDEDFALDIVSGRFRFISTTQAKEAKASVPIAQGVWTHVVGVYDAAVDSTTLYLNGVAAASNATAAPNTRSTTGLKLSIGNRGDAAGEHTLPFYGRIDSVRVLHRALKASEVLAHYQGGFVSTVTPSSPNNGVLVALPPNAFTAPVQIYVSADPAAHPIRIPYATLSAGLSALPVGMTLVPNSIVEVVPIVGGLPFTTALGSSATVSIPYGDADGNNLVDGTVLPASAIRMYTLNTTVNRWEELSTSIDPVNRRAGGLTPHFSVFALFAPSTVGASLSGVRIYPIPWKPGSGARFDSPGLTFDNLPASGAIHILTLAGEHVADIRFDGSSAGTATWDGRTKHGRRCASGVYFAKIVSDTGGSMLAKFAIER